MPKYVIERDVPGAGRLSPDELRTLAGRSCDVLDRLGPQVRWLESYVTDDRLYCVYLAPSETLIRDHAKRGGFPCNRVSQVRRIIDPAMADLPSLILA